MKIGDSYYTIRKTYIYFEDGSSEEVQKDTRFIVTNASSGTITIFNKLTGKLARWPSKQFLESFYLRRSGHPLTKCFK